MSSIEKRFGIVRPLTFNDMAKVKEVIEASGLFPAEMLDDMTAGFFDGTSDGDFWLTLDDPDPVAIIYCAPERMTMGTWNMLLIAVHPKRHGQGYGTQLVRFTEKLLSERGERILLVETSALPEFDKTRSFYRMLGYHEEARIRDYYQAGEDKIVFRKALGL